MGYGLSNMWPDWVNNLYNRIGRSKWWIEHRRPCFVCKHRGLVRDPDSEYESLRSAWPDLQVYACPQCGAHEIVRVNVKSLATQEKT